MGLRWFGGELAPFLIVLSVGTVGWNPSNPSFFSIEQLLLSSPFFSSPRNRRGRKKR